MSDDTAGSATDRVVQLEESVTGARVALEKTEAALRGVEKVARGADRARAHPVLVIFGVLVTLGAVAFLANHFGSGGGA